MTLIANFVTLQNGSVAEWLGRGLQNLVQRFKSARNLQFLKTPNEASFFVYACKRIHEHLKKTNTL